MDQTDRLLADLKEVKRKLKNAINRKSYWMRQILAQHYYITSLHYGYIESLDAVHYWKARKAVLLNLLKKEME